MVGADKEEISRKEEDGERRLLVAHFGARERRGY